MEEKIELLHTLVNAADIEAAQSEYAAVNGMEINGEIECSLIRKIFGWEVSPAAVAVKRTLFGE